MRVSNRFEPASGLQGLAKSMANDVKSAHRELTGKIMGRPGISGTAIGERRGKPCLKVYVSDPGAGRRVPKNVGGFPVVVEKTGPFERL